jgi:hypothetical protein
VLLTHGYCQLFYVGNGCYLLSTTFIKLSLLFQYLRIFEDGKHRRICIYAIVVVSLWGLTYTVLAWVPCVPVHGFWDIYMTDKYCFGYGSQNASQFVAMFETHAALNMAFDLLVFVLPIPLYFKPNTMRQQRLSLLVLFFIGGL